MADFSGFGPPSIAFLEGLSRDNSKAWFDANRAAYEEHYLEPAKAFVAAIGTPLRALAPGIEAEPRVNGSIFRINRDIRFSRNKTPYKDHLDLWFWEGDRKRAISGFFFRLTQDRLILGAGAHRFTPEQLSAYREALGDARAADALLALESGLERHGLILAGEHYARPPRGLHLRDAALEGLSRHNALHASHEGPHPDVLASPAFIDYCIDRWRALAPLHRWLVELAV